MLYVIVKPFFNSFFFFFTESVNIKGSKQKKANCDI